MAQLGSVVPNLTLHPMISDALDQVISNAAFNRISSIREKLHHTMDPIILSLQNSHAALNYSYGDRP